MKIKILAILFVVTAALFVGPPKASAQEFNVCIAQFPCHLKTGKLLPGFAAGTPCGWEKICQNYRNTKEFKKLQKKLQRQKRESLRNSL